MAVEDDEDDVQEEYFYDLGAPPADAEEAQVFEEEEEDPADEPEEDEAEDEGLTHRVRLRATNTIALRHGTLWFGA